MQNVADHPSASQGVHEDVQITIKISNQCFKVVKCVYSGLKVVGHQPILMLAPGPILMLTTGPILILMLASGLTIHHSTSIIRPNFSTFKFIRIFSVFKKLPKVQKIKRRNFFNYKYNVVCGEKNCTVKNYLTSLTYIGYVVILMRSANFMKWQKYLLRAEYSCFRDSFFFERFVCKAYYCSYTVDFAVWRC